MADSFTNTQVQDVVIPTSNLCQDKAVQMCIKNNRLDVIVTQTGDIYGDPNSSRLRNPVIHAQLIRVVTEACNNRCKFVEVKSFQVRRVLEDISKDKEGSRSDSGGAMKRDEELKWIFETGIRGKASDIYFYVGPDGDARVEMKVFGRNVLICHLTSERALTLVSVAWTGSGGVNSQYSKTETCDVSFDFPLDNSFYCVRGNSLPLGNGGVTVAFRIRDPKEILPLDKLGYSKLQLQHLRDMMGAPGGLILLTGPTGSGKSTTIASMLAMIPDDFHIITVEDPIEVDLANCEQVELNRYHKKYSEQLRKVMGAIVRQNPDYLCLAEIRDIETAQMAINIAIQGKGVLSSLHCATAGGVFARLGDFGIPDHVLALPEFMAGAVNQNLVPIPCDCCCFDFEEARSINSDEGREYYFSKLSRYFSLDVKDMRFVNSDGCDDENCRNGVSGQSMVAEVFPFCIDSTEEVFDLVSRKEYKKISKYMSREHGCLSKAEHARKQCIEGKVDPLRVFNIIGDFTLGEEVKNLSAVDNVVGSDYQGSHPVM